MLFFFIIFSVFIEWCHIVLSAFLSKCLRPYVNSVRLCENISLTHQVPVLPPSYRNQSIDFLGKSLGWFLYEGNIGT